MPLFEAQAFVTAMSGMTVTEIAGQEREGIWASRPRRPQPVLPARRVEGPSFYLASHGSSEHAWRAAIRPHARFSALLPPEIP